MLDKFNQFLKKYNINFKISNKKQQITVNNPLDILNVRYTIKNNKTTIHGNFRPTSLFIEILKQPLYIQKVLGDVNILNINLYDFKMFNFEYVKGDFYCYKNNLTSLQGSPKEVGGTFDCYNNILTSLQGSPKEVGGGFICSGNKLTSLQGSPKKVGGNFYCNSNNLTSLQGGPKEVGGNFNCNSNSKQFTQQQVRKYCNVKGWIYN